MKTPKLVDNTGKRGALNKTNAQVLAIVAAACFGTIFCLFAAKTVLSNNSYLAKVISEKQKVRDQLQDNQEEFGKLKAAYTAFDGASSNIIGGVKDGSGDNDGSNSKIILDGLPPTYDFPALTSSVEKLVKDVNLRVSGIQGTDDQLNQQANAASPSPQTVEMPFSFTVENANYASVQKVVSATQKSIRPLHIDKVTVSGGGSNMTLTLDIRTFYQPAKNVDYKTRTVK